jgi:predicted Zn-dependent protease
MCLLLAGCQVVNTTRGGVVGVDSSQYMFILLSPYEVNQQYAQAYQQAISEADSEGTLQSDTVNAQRVNTIAQRLIAQVPVFRDDALDWEWEVNLIESSDLNANCGPGGKIMVYTGLIDRLDLSDDELAAVMGHEIAHALREHGRAAMSQAYGLQMALEMSTLLGVKDSERQLAQLGSDYLLTLPNSRENEEEADLIGLELASRAGYDPQAALTLWQKMAEAGGAGTLEFMSTHPSSGSRMAALQEAMPKVLPLYQQVSGR